MNADDVRKMLDSVFDRLSPAKAQELAKGLLGDDRREQAQKLASDLMDSAQRNRDRVRDLIAREVAAQVKTMGVATQADLDALKRRVRELERASGAAGPTARSGAAKRTSSPAKRTAASKAASSTAPTAPKRVAAGSPRAKQPAKGAAAAETPATDPGATPSTPKRSSAAGSAGRPTRSGPSTP